MERKFETMVRWRSETIVQWIDRFEAPLAELEVARDGLASYTEQELTYLWKQAFSDNISGEEIQIITTRCLGVGKLIVCETWRIIWTARSTRSSLEAYAS
jgi:hypothetical protein